MAGLAAGGLRAGGLPPGDQSALVDQARAMLGGGAAPLRPPGEAGQLLLALGAEVRRLALLLLLGVSAVGAPGILLLLGLQGYATGFAVGLFSRDDLARGLLVSAGAVLPHTLLAFPAALSAGSAGLRIAALMAHRLWTGRWPRPLPPLGGLAATAAGALALAAGAALARVYVSGPLGAWVARLVGG